MFALLAEQYGFGTARLARSFLVHFPNKDGAVICPACYLAFSRGHDEIRGANRLIRAQ
ncbi:hypothetical protein GGD56_006439 [Rhizobium mongolense]|uniref:Uncharacterized protein n=1 Tax=Rhizobium mongolense TaxID=57676 RepID=A0ABR6IX88_9HYPH|nr:hypothetical protein [Rhizobium mongolense]